MMTLEAAFLEVMTTWVSLEEPSLVKATRVASRMATRFSQRVISRVSSIARAI